MMGASSDSEQAGVARHEAGHAFGYWRLGGRIKRLWATRGVNIPGRFDPAVINSGMCAGTFTETPGARAWSEKNIACYFLGGLAAMGARSSTGDMQLVIKQVLDAAGGDEALLGGVADAIRQGCEPGVLEDFFNQHSPKYEAMLDDTARAAIEMLANEVERAPGLTMDGKRAAMILEAAYGDTIPPGIIPWRNHGKTGPVSTLEILDDCVRLLDFLLQEVTAAKEDDPRLEAARQSIVGALFRIAAL